MLPRGVPSSRSELRSWFSIGTREIPATANQSRHITVGDNLVVLPVGNVDAGRYDSYVKLLGELRLSDKVR
jgi:hypothetical protein